MILPGSQRRCFPGRQQSYARSADSGELDGSVLLALLPGYGDGHSPRWRSTAGALGHDLGYGPFVCRYTGKDGLAGGEGAFVSCSSWLAEALQSRG